MRGYTAYTRTDPPKKNGKNGIDPDAPGTPGKPGFEPPVRREDLDEEGKAIWDKQREPK